MGEGLYIGFAGKAQMDDDSVKQDRLVSLSVYYSMAEIEDLIQALNKELGYSYQKLSHRQMVMES
jgi:hypothetical protein